MCVAVAITILFNNLLAFASTFSLSARGLKLCVCVVIACVFKPAFCGNS